MKKYALLVLSILLTPSISFAHGIDNGRQQVTKQRDIADYNCRNNLPNPRAAIGFCNKRDGLNRKLQNMNNGRAYNQRYNRHHNNRNHQHYNNHHNHYNRH